MWVLAIASLNILGMIKSIYCYSNCSNLTTKTQCITDSGCIWAADMSKDVCANIHPDCTRFQNSSSDCLATPGCLFQPGQDGFCNQKPSLGCGALQMSDCQANSSCVWTSIQECENKDGGFGCVGLAEDKCNELFYFCSALYTCNDIDEQKCKDLSKQDCLDAKEYCDYAETQTEICSYKDGFCENLLPDECLSNLEFCSFQQTVPFTCVDNVGADICGAKVADDCSINTVYCDLLPQPCVNKVQCTTYTTQDECNNNLCTFNNNQCIQPVDCSSFTNQSDCSANPTCQQTPSLCRNKSTFNCSAKTNYLDCKANLQFCAYTPATGTCQQNNKCSKLVGYDCQFFQKQCNYTPEVGTCTIKNGLKCSEKTRIDCLDFPYCIATFTQCSDIQGDVCSIMNKNECGQQASHCKSSAQGYCSDNIIKCPSDKTSCTTNLNCDWMGEVPDTCVVSLDCSINSQTECQEAVNLCNYTPGGNCVSNNQSVQALSQYLAFSPLLFSFIVIIAFS